MYLLLILLAEILAHHLQLKCMGGHGIFVWAIRQNTTILYVIL